MLIDEWNDYKKDVLGNYTENFVLGQKRAFHIGARTMYKLFIDAIDSAQSADEYNLKIEEIYKEIKAWDLKVQVEIEGAQLKLV